MTKEHDFHNQETQLYDQEKCSCQGAKNAEKLGRNKPKRPHCNEKQ